MDAEQWGLPGKVTFDLRMKGEREKNTLEQKETSEQSHRAE